MVAQVNAQNSVSQASLFKSGGFSGISSNTPRPASHVQQAQNFNGAIGDLAKLHENIRNATIHTLDLKPVDLGNILRNLDKLPDIGFSDKAGGLDKSNDKGFFKDIVDKSNDTGFSGINGNSPIAGDNAVNAKPKGKASDVLGINKTFGADVAKIVAKSPTLTNDLKALEKAGWKIVSQTGGGSTCNKATKTITVDTQGSDAANIVQTLAHEAGHARYTGKVDTSSKKAFVDSNLADEGAATLNNIKVQREILKNGGPDIGISGNSSNHAAYNKAYDNYVKTGNATTARAEIGAIFGNGEITSNTGQTYSDYYGSFYDANYAPKPAPQSELGA
jgi:hypothetical protein